MSFKVVSTTTIAFHIDKEGFRKLDGVEFFDRPSTTEDEIIEAAHDADAVVIVLDPYTRRVIDSLKSCRLITTAKTGYGNIDIAAVCNCRSGAITTGSCGIHGEFSVQTTEDRTSRCIRSSMTAVTY